MNRLSTGMFLWPSSLSKVRGAPSNSPTSSKQSVQSQLFMLLSLLRPSGAQLQSLSFSGATSNKIRGGDAMKRQSRPIGPVEFIDKMMRIRRVKPLLNRVRVIEFERLLREG
jgi:hypothetical protein